MEGRWEVAAEAWDRRAGLGYANVHVRCGDGTLGLPELAPFDAILVAAAAPSVPAPLIEPLATRGRMIVPVGDAQNQDLQLIARVDGALRTTTLEPSRSRPLVVAH